MGGSKGRRKETACSHTVSASLGDNTDVWEGEAPLGICSAKGSSAVVSRECAGGSTVRLLLMQGESVAHVLIRREWKRRVLAGGAGLSAQVFERWRTSL